MSLIWIRDPLFSIDRYIDNYCGLSQGLVIGNEIIHKSQLSHTRII